MGNSNWNCRGYPLSPAGLDWRGTYRNAIDHLVTSLDDTLSRLLVPDPLRSGDRIGIIAPASPFDRGLFEEGVSVLESLGFSVSVSQDLFMKDRYLAGSDLHRADLVNRLFVDETIDGIFCARGGFGTMRMLEHLDFGSIRENPKVLVGFSDITALLSAIYANCRLVTFHGPVVTFLRDASRQTLDALYAALTFEGDLKVRAEDGMTVFSGSATGPVTGGNLTTLCHLIGTPFQPRYRGHILFLEDLGEAGYRIDRMLTQMKLAGCFDEIVGLFLGSFEGCGSISDIITILKDIFSSNPIPIAAGFNIGHGTNHHTIPLGLPAILDADEPSLSYLEPSRAASSFPDDVQSSRDKRKVFVP